jgi:type II secretory pathway predicted ATPase ExeA
MPKTMPTLHQLAERDERVFPSYPQVARYFPAGAIEDALGKLGRAIERGNGPGLVIGGPGTGKSLLLQVLAAQYHEQFDIVLPACARLCTRRALLQSILFELGMPYRSRDEGELRLSLLDHLLSKEECPTGLLLLVDEAQTLPVSLLDELRVLTNVVRGGVPRVRLVIAGSSSLEERFADPELESFSQRLAARCYLGPFTGEETTHFVRAQLSASGAAPDDVFSSDAWAAVFEATDGVPRLVNQLCDRALTDANAAGHTQIDRQIIQSAWADLQQLPAPWDTPEQASENSASSVVEFGNLVADEFERGAKAPSSCPLQEGEGLDADADDVIVTARLAEFDTELDEDDEVGAAQEPAPPEPTANPFAEQFDEEEVVLDNFAAWDEMFRRDTLRVANRRDPGFATRVTAAMKASAGEASPSSPAADLSFEFDLQNIIDEDDDSDVDSRGGYRRDDAARPPLRIADISEAPPASRAAAGSIDDEPVLIVEDDADAVMPAKSPVRREEYRNLFSRLRSE